MKFFLRLNIILLAAIMLLVPLADMVGCVECFFPGQGNINICQEAESSVPAPALIHSAHCSHCKSSGFPLQNNSEHFCPICNNGTPLISSTNFSLNLSRGLFKRCDKVIPIPEVHSVPYIPPRSA